VLNARIRKRWRQSNVAIALIGERADLAYPYDYLGAGPQTLQELVDGKHSFAATLRDATTPMIVVGSAAVARPDGAGCWAPTSSTRGRWARPSSSTRAATAMRAPSAPTWSCRAPPTPRRARPT
jgi:hypothetical protein